MKAGGENDEGSVVVAGENITHIFFYHLLFWIDSKLAKHDSCSAIHGTTLVVVVGNCRRRP